MIDSNPVASAAAPATTGAGRYLYGVVRADAMPVLERERLDLGGALLPVRHGEVCALTAAAPTRMAHETLSQHAEVVQQVFDRVTVLPARFGVVLPDVDRVVGEFLDPYHDQLVEQLERLDGMAQVDVTGIHQERPALARLLRADRALAAQRRQPTRSQLALIRLGERVAAGLDRMRAHDAAMALALLRQHAVDERPSAISHQHMFLHASFLTRTSELHAFDGAMGRLRQGLPHAMTRAVGPLAPYAFVELHPVKDKAWG